VTESDSICQLAWTIANCERIARHLKRNVTAARQFFINFSIFEWLIKSSGSSKSNFYAESLAISFFTQPILSVFGSSSS
jgi:hypothetical protein